MAIDQEVIFSNKVLAVDDEPRILTLFTRMARGRLDLTTANNAVEGLRVLEEQGPFGVVMSDMRMPEMDGVTFLSKVLERWPLTVRILFTAYADLESAVKAINKARIFRLLNKPADTMEIIAALEDGLKQHRMLVADEANIIERERQFRTALFDLPLPARIHAEDGEIVLLNRAWEELSGWSAAELPDMKTWYALAYHADGPEPAMAEQLFDHQGRPLENDHNIEAKDGRSLVWNFSSAPLGTMPDGRRAVISIASDVTQRRAVEESLRLADQVFTNTTNGMLVTDSRRVILDVNPALCDISGYSREELIGQNPRLFKSDRHDQDFYRLLWYSVRTYGSWRGELWNRRKDGEVYPAWLTISRVGGGQGNGAGAEYIGVISDLSSLRQAQKRMEYLARHDPLTGLPNRVFLQDRLGQAVAYADQEDTRVLVGYLGLDEFKLINESLGHSAGDNVLIEVGRRLKQCMSESDTVVRWAGDNFVLVSKMTGGDEEAARTAQKILTGLSTPMEVGPARLFLTGSLGLSLYPTDAETPEALIQHADTAMNEAKKQGRNQYTFFVPAMNRQVVERLSLENELRIALERNEFTLVYQPQVDLADGRIRGLEALVRWRHPQRGLASPGEFLTAAEQSGLIIPLGKQVLKMACAQMSDWARQGLTLPTVAVNLSARQMWEEDLVETVSRIMAESDCPAKRLELEVTESVIMSSVKEAVRVLDSLTELGIEVSMDDFGTGYSSLYYLKKLPFVTLKVDKSFVDDLPGDRDSANIVASIIAMAHGLGKQVLIEGVETKEQLEVVASFGCDVVQGYYFSRPVPPDQATRLLAESPTPYAHMLPGA